MLLEEHLDRRHGVKTVESFLMQNEEFEQFVRHAQDEAPNLYEDFKYKGVHFIVGAYFSMTMVSRHRDYIDTFLEVEGYEEWLQEMIDEEKNKSE
jgi:hypothetical protein